MIKGTISYSKKTHQTLVDILTGHFPAGRFDELEVDGGFVDDLDDLPEVWSESKYAFIINQSTADKFYKNSDEFISASCLSKGLFPKEYYIVEDDFYSEDKHKPSFIGTLEKTLSLISSLAKIAHYHDIKSEGSSSFYRLVFVMHSESKSTSAVIETSLSKEILLVENFNIDLINNLVSINPLTDAHYDEKINTFRNTLIEYINDNKANFTDLIVSWDSVNRLYTNNLAVYMSAFSFHKSRKEIADAEIDFAEKTSKTLLDLSSKVLAIPISLVGAIGLLKLSDKTEIIIALAGLFLTSLIMHLTILSQQNQFYRIRHAKSIVFESMNKKIEDNKNRFEESNDLKVRITEALDNLSKNEIFCSRVLWFLLIAAWAPVSAGALITLFKLIG
ncbi:MULTISPECIES: hypothetical protein [unclassified Pantoea]|uniref:hypothetical protein n=1 Tax=unclassified Pantoea TaxID=2630326 RepID=UPI00257B0B9B|nr:MULTISPECIES: hypothetical protein [unclassified Pantoea]MDU5473999.1 hypothetical protein [Pantoea sp.]